MSSKSPLEQLELNAIGNLGASVDPTLELAYPRSKGFELLPAAINHLLKEEISINSSTPTVCPQMAESGFRAGESPWEELLEHGVGSSWVSIQSNGGSI